MFDLFKVFLFSGVEKDPDIEVFTLRFFDALNEVVGGKGSEDFIDHDWRVIGSLLYVILCARVLLDHVVDSSVVLHKNGVEDSMNTLFLYLGL